MNANQLINFFMRRLMYKGINRTAAHVARRTAKRDGSAAGGAHAKSTKKLGKRASRALRFGQRFLRR